MIEEVKRYTEEFTDDVTTMLGREPSISELKIISICAASAAAQDLIDKGWGGDK